MLTQLLCNYEAGCDALLSSGSLKAILPLIKTPVKHVKFSVRAARILEMVLSMSSNSNTAFIEYDAVGVFIARLQHEGKESAAECIGSMIGVSTANHSHPH